MSANALARAVSRLALLGPEQELAIDIADEGLRTALGSLATSAGAILYDAAAGETSICPNGVVDLATVPAPLVPERVKRLIGRVAPGGTVIVIVHSGLDNPQHAAQVWGVSFDLHKVHGEKVEDAIILRGTRRLPIERSRLKALRQIAHALPATVLIGREGLTSSLIAAAQSALERHGLVKIRQTPMCKLPKAEVVSDLLWATGAQLVSRIGGVSVLYRGDVPFEPPRSQKG
jgi:RNA-binding protein